MGVKRSRGMILTIEDDEVISGQSESEEEAEEEEEQILDADFEFDVQGVNSGIKGIEDDGWGFKGVTGLKEGASVDLDGIIARRRKKFTDGQEPAEGGEEEESENSDDEDEEDDESGTLSGEPVEDESESESEEWKGFDDDELGICSKHVN